LKNHQFPQKIWVKKEYDFSKLLSFERKLSLPALITTTELIGNNKLKTTKLIKITLENMK